MVSDELRQPAIVLLDELGAALAAPELDAAFWWSLRSLGSHQTRGNLAFLFTAHAAPALLSGDPQQPSPFLNMFGYTCQLGPLTEAEARELIASSPRPFAPDDVDWILQQSERWPSLLQILCHTRLATLDEPEHQALWRVEGLRQIAPYRYLLEAPPPGAP